MFQRYEGSAWEERFLPRLTSRQVKELDKQNALIILSIGAVEQHGDHMPIMTDALIGEATLTQAMEKLDPALNIWMIPPLSYGKSNEHIGLAGTLSLSAETLRGFVMDIAASLCASGFRRLLLFNTHGGNTDLLNVIAREVRIATGLMVFFISPGSFSVADDLMSQDELEFGIHGGDYETSIVKAIKPEWVRDEWIVDELPDMSRYQYLTMESKIRFFWKMSDISKSGILGEASKATAEKGMIIQERVTDLLAEAMAEMCSFELEEFITR